MQIDAQVILIIFTIITFFITIGTMVWRMAILHHQCMTNKESLLRAHERIDKLEDTQTNKIEELVAQIRVIEQAQIRMEEKLNLLLKREENGNKA